MYMQNITYVWWFVLTIYKYISNTANKYLAVTYIQWGRYGIRDMVENKKKEVGAIVSVFEFEKGTGFVA